MSAVGTGGRQKARWSGPWFPFSLGFASFGDLFNFMRKTKCVLEND